MHARIHLKTSMTNVNMTEHENLYKTLYLRMQTRMSSFFGSRGRVG